MNYVFNKIPTKATNNIIYKDVRPLQSIHIHCEVRPLSFLLTPPNL